jgi:hypothetical protein
MIQEAEMGDRGRLEISGLLQARHAVVMISVVVVALRVIGRTEGVDCWYWN